MRRLAAALLVLVGASLARADLDNPGPLMLRDSVPINCGVMDWDSTEIDLIGSTCVPTLNPLASPTGLVIGEPADFRSKASGGVDTSGTTTRQFVSAGMAAGDCDAAGESAVIAYNSSDTTGTRFYGCRGTDGWKEFGGPLEDGAPGGQTLNGDTQTSGGGLTLNPNPTGVVGANDTVKLCNYSPAMTVTDSATSYPCAVVHPNGLKLTTASSAAGFTGLSIFGANGNSPTVEQTASQILELFAPMQSVYTYKTTGSSPGYFPVIVGYYNRVTIDNAATAAPDGTFGFAFFDNQIDLTKSGSGVNYTVGAIDGWKLGTIASGVTLTDHYGGRNIALGCGGGGTCTRQWGYRVGAPGGTSGFQYAANEWSAGASTPPGDVVAWGAESGSPGRFVAVNENGVKHRLGQTTWTGSSNNSNHCTTNNCNDYIAINSPLYSNTQATTQVFLAPGALKVHHMACAVTAIAAGRTRTFWITAGGSDTAMSCAIVAPATTCTTASQSVAVAAGALLNIHQQHTGGGSGTEAPSTCTTWWTLDNF